jgi:hypothetical protein
MKVRQEARTSIALIGEDLMVSIRNLTDVALKYVDHHSDDLYSSWKEALGEMYLAAEKSIKMLR